MNNNNNKNNNSDSDSKPIKNNKNNNQTKLVYKNADVAGFHQRRSGSPTAEGRTHLEKQNLSGEDISRVERSSTELEVAVSNLCSTGSVNIEVAERSKLYFYR
ncbi:hypothetical protein HELRODRAFT_180781 [Helobdella robusta]|uniref:Uncharacterized protein n=1 Tax=Helobdella robusta TaxID=6412 RepID=T1FG98_HELRO|nr:hypothetical protein HELRODRAFT_180781 [Helobdella robusta]ESN93684.1 hypothetical protein HELRODRAFT_180781 [Helobdella robusta]